MQFRHALRDAVRELEAAWTDCFAGRRPEDGQIGFEIVFASDGGVESSEIEDDLTSIEDPELVDCVARTPQTIGMNVGPLPEGVDGIDLHDSVIAKDGGYAGRGGIDFTYLRGEDPLDAAQ